MASLVSLDMEAIEDMDPSLSNGFSVLYDRECPFEIRFQEEEGSDRKEGGGTLEAIKAKILVQGEEEMPTAYRIELSSENDLFFQYQHVVNVDAFRKVYQIRYSYFNQLFIHFNKLIFIIDAGSSKINDRFQ